MNCLSMSWPSAVYASNRPMTASPLLHRLVGPVVKASAPRAADLGSIPALLADLFPGPVTPVGYTGVLRWLPCQASGVIGSAMGLVGPVSVYRDWVRLHARSATSVSVWQHVPLSAQIRPRDTLACCCAWTLSNQQATSSCSSAFSDRLVGLVVKASTSRAEGPGFESH